MKPMITVTCPRAGLLSCAGPCPRDGHTHKALPGRPRLQFCLQTILSEGVSKFKISPQDLWGKEFKLSWVWGGAFQSRCLPAVGPAVTHCFL